MSRFRWLLLIGLLTLPLTGCSLSAGRLVDADQPTQDQGLAVLLEPGQPVGQTFVARHDGLSGIEFFLVPTGTSALTLTLHVRAEPWAADDLAQASLDLPAGAAPGFYRWTLPPLEDSHGQYYYAFLDASSSGTSVALANGDAYLDGAAYRAHVPLDAQSSFRLVYSPAPMALGFAKASLGGLGLLGAAALLFVLPGWALLAWLLPAGRRLAWPELLGLAAGVSLAVYPILVLWTHLVGLNLGALYVWLPLAGSLAALGWRYRRWRPRQGIEAVQCWARSDALWPDLALLAMLGLVFGVRLLVVRTLEAPMWGDGFQHTLITQLMADQGGLFSSWAPYAKLETFTYHFGFHTAAAGLHWLTGLPVVDATLWAGQLMNGLAVVALYPLATRVTGSRWGGVWAVLLAGLLAPMPMAYLNWGRYTQLAGQAILPAAVWLTWEAVEAPRRHWRFLALVALVVGGLALTHYRVLLFYAIFGLTLLLTRARGNALRETLLRQGLVGVGAGLLFLPWFLNTFRSELDRMLSQPLTTLPSQTHAFVQEYNAVGSLDSYLAPVWWLALALGLGMGLWQRRRGVLLVGLWWFLALIATNPAWLSLPGTGIITNFALFIAVYVPAGLLTGFLVVSTVRPVAHYRWAAALAAVILVGVGAWGARERLGDPQPARHILATRPDVRAGAWIRQHTPPEAQFLVSSLFAYGQSVVAGSDGGWWLPLLAGRQPTVPPLNYNSELGPSPQYRAEVNELAQFVHDLGPEDPRVRQRLREKGVTYIYVGQRQGSVNDPGESVIEPEDLAQSAHYETVYHQDRVWIFALVGP